MFFGIFNSNSKNKNHITLYDYKNYDKRIENMLKQISASIYYFEYIIKYYKVLDTFIQLVTLIATIISCIFLFTSSIENRTLSYIFYLIPICSQLLTFIYPYLFTFNEKILRSSIFKLKEEIIFDKYYCLYSKIKNGSTEEMKDLYFELYSEYITLKREFTDNPKIQFIDNKFQIKSVEESSKELKIHYF